MGSRVDYEHRFGLVATSGAAHRIVGHAGYELTNGDRAEVAFEVADDFQGRGLGTILLVHLAEAAEEQGVAIFEASVLPENYRMAEVFRESGFLRADAIPAGSDLGGDADNDLPGCARALRRAGARRRGRRRAEVPRAGVGGRDRCLARARHGRWRRSSTICSPTGFNGPVHPVNPQADVVQSVRAFKSVAGRDGRRRPGGRGGACGRCRRRGTGVCGKRRKGAGRASPPASRRPVPRALRDSTSCSGSAARAACG